MELQPEQRPRKLVSTEEDYQNLLAVVRTAETIAIDVETSGVEDIDNFNPWKGWLVGIAIAVIPQGRSGAEDAVAYYIPMRTRDPAFFQQGGKTFTEQQCAALVESGGLRERNRWLMYNAKFDLKWLERLAPRIRFDTYAVRDPGLEWWVCDSSNAQVGLKDLTNTFFPNREQPKTYEELVGRGKNKQKIEDVPVAEVAWYAMADVLNTLDVGEWTYSRLESRAKDLKLYDSIERPLLRLLTDMEVRGVYIDREGLDALSTEMLELAYETEKKLAAFADINWNSNMQVVEFLTHEGVQFPPVYTPSGRQKLDKAVLERIAPQHAAAENLLLHKDLGKLNSTYITNMYKMLDAENRLHGDFRQTGTRTSRLSSGGGVNLQNIPARDKKGSVISSAYARFRELFVRNPGSLGLIMSDLSQIEMRFAAHFSKDPGLLHIYNNGLDLHGEVSSAVTGGNRTLAKNINFGFLYGQRARGLANLTGMSLMDAQKFITRYEKRFAELVLWTKRVEAHAARNGFTETILGRRRYLPDMRSSDYGKVAAAARQAVNSQIQGSAAEYLKVAMLNIDHELRPLGIHTILQVHDELVWDMEPGVDDKTVQEAMRRVQYWMEHAMKLSVPVVAEPKLVQNWAEGK